MISCASCHKEQTEKEFNRNQGCIECGNRLYRNDKGQLIYSQQITLTPPKHKSVLIEEADWTRISTELHDLKIKSIEMGGNIFVLGIFALTSIVMSVITILIL